MVHTMEICKMKRGIIIRKYFILINLFNYLLKFLQCYEHLWTLASLYFVGKKIKEMQKMDNENSYRKHFKRKFWSIIIEL